MPTVQTHTLEEAHDSFDILKREARNLDDISNWFAKNIHIFELPEGAVVESVKAAVSFVQMFDIFFEDDPDHMVMSVKLKVKLDPSTVPTFLGSLDAKSHDVQPKAERWSFPVTVTDWSFAIARLAYHYLEARGYDHQTHPAYAACKACLDVQLPLHFSGLTTETLRALSAGGLLDVASPDFYDSLFAIRNKAIHLKELPADVGANSFGL